MNYRDVGRHNDALLLFKEIYQSGKKHTGIAGFGDTLLEFYVQTGKTEEAAGLSKELLADARRQLAEESTQLARELASTGKAMLDIKAFTEAEPLLRECLAIREKMNPNTWTTFNSKTMLGGALLGQKKYIDAEQLLLAGYEGMKQREKAIPWHGSARVPEALDRLIQLYTETNKPDEVKKWQAEKDKLPKEPAKK